MVLPGALLVSPSYLSEEGGLLLTLTGTFTLQHRYQVYLGGTGTTADPGCPSGVAGQGYIIYPRTTGVMYCYSPVLAPGGPYTLTVENLELADTIQAVDAVLVLRRQFRSKVYGMRRLFAPWLKTGPRAVDREAL